MAKRFIDTNMFNDEWVCGLSKDSKLFFIYYITTCDHAGVLRLNRKLCDFQIGVKDFDRVIKELGNCLVTVKPNLFFMPKFIKFQYPNFPNSTVKQQDSAMKILLSLDIDSEKLKSYLTLTQDLTKYYDSDNGSVIVKDYSYVSLEFKTVFEKWMKYKKDRKEKYKSIDSEKSFYNSLLKLSNKNPIIADSIVEQSMANNWAGIFELKDAIKPAKQTTAPDYESFRQSK